MKYGRFLMFENVPSTATREMYTLFPTFMGRVELGCEVFFDGIQEEIRKYIEEREEDFGYLKHWGKTHELSVPNFGDSGDPKTEEEEMKYDLFNHLKILPSVVEEEIVNYIRYVNPQLPQYMVDRSTKRTGSWITRMNQGDYVHLHQHVPASIAGVYYYQVPPSDDPYSGSFYVETPVNFHKARPVSMTSGTKIDIGLDKPITAGTLLLFPASLEHGVTRHLEPDPRISISFNYGETCL